MLFRSATFVNGSTLNDRTTATLGTVVNNATVYYRNSFSTAIPFGTVPIAAGSVSQGITSAAGQRTLAILSYHEGQEKIIDITTPPLTTVPGYSQRRLINASADVPMISAAYDTSYRSKPDVPHMAFDVPFGTSSSIETITQVNRGSVYVYNSETLELHYTLPNDLGPLGNSYSLIFVGSRLKGYEVIVLQEF